MILYFSKVNLSESTERRTTEQAGQAYVEVQTAQVEVLEKELPESPEGPSVQLMSVDGAFVPLIHKGWAEVKTLAIGSVGEPVLEKGEPVVHTKDLSYFSRLEDHETFARLATVETHRRGTEKAGIVCAVVDGADWEQKFIDLHCPDAVRILDWGHASEYVVKAGQAVFGTGTADVSEWLGDRLHELKHGDPQNVLGELRRLLDEPLGPGGSSLGSEAIGTVRSSLEYLEKRQDQIRYAEFLAAGYPIGSGAVESANKLVVEARLKGSGMHWSRANVNPMVALRTIACNDRWEEAWPQISERLRQEAKDRAEAHRSNSRVEQTAITEVATPSELKAEIGSSDNLPDVTRVVECELAAPLTPPRADASGSTDPQVQTNTPRRPAANHPWRRMSFGRARFEPFRSNTGAKT